MASSTKKAFTVNLGKKDRVCLENKIGKDGYPLVTFLSFWPVATKKGELEKIFDTCVPNLFS